MAGRRKAAVAAKDGTKPKRQRKPRAKKAEKEEEPERKEIDMNQLARGSFLTGFMVVRKGDVSRIDGVNGYLCDKIDLMNNQTTMFHIDTEMANKTYQDTTYTRSIKLSRTKLIEKLEEARRIICKVKFQKKVKPEETQALLEDAELETADQRKEMVQRILNSGEERELTGLLVRSSREWARSTMLDLHVYMENQAAGFRAAERQVDHRSLSEVIYGGTRYYCD